MAGLQSSSNTGTGVSAGIHDVFPVVMLRVVQECLDSRLGETPCTSVQRLLLTPDDRLCVGVGVEVLLQLLPRERVQLLNSGDGSVLDVVVGAVLGESGIYLTGAKDDTVNLFRLIDALAMFRIRDDPLELRFASELFNRRSSDRMTKEGLREEDNESYERSVRLGK